MDLFDSIEALSAGLGDGLWSSTELVDQALARIERYDAVLNSFLAVDHDGARAAALEADDRRTAGAAIGDLDGVPIAIKDNVDVVGMPATSGTPIRSGYEPVADGELAARLRAAGAVIVGKTNMTEYAMGSTGANVHFGDACNPWNPDRYTGGSSAGSGAAAAGGLVPGAVGSDTACSIRLPAHACGIVGHKPTYDRVARTGATHCTPRLDHFGPMTRSVRSAATMLAVMQQDGWSTPRIDPTRRLRIGVLGGDFDRDIDPGVAGLYESALEVLGDLGHALDPIDLGIDLKETDVQANVFGVDFVVTYDEELRANPDLLGPELSKWVEEYREVEAGAIEEAEAYQRHVVSITETAMRSFDVVVAPTAKVTAGLRADAATENRDLRALHCSLFDVTGQPSMSVPMGFTSAGLPAGLMITAAFGDDETVFDAAAGYEDATEWLSVRPDYASLSGSSHEV